MFYEHLDSMSWICGYKSKKEEVLNDYEEIVRNLTQMNLHQNEPEEWNFEITTHKIRVKSSTEEFNLLKKGQKEMPNMILNTLLNYAIAYTDVISKNTLIFYSNFESEIPLIKCKFLFF